MSARAIGLTVLPGYPARFLNLPLVNEAKPLIAYWGPILGEESVDCGPIEGWTGEGPIEGTGLGPIAGADEGPTEGATEGPIDGATEGPIDGATTASLFCGYTMSRKPRLIIGM